MKRYFSWVTKSNRPQHVFVGLLIGLIFGATGAFVAACTAEAKDWLWNGKKGGIFGWVVGNGFDWLDLAATLIGGAIGCLPHYLIFWSLRL